MDLLAHNSPVPTTALSLSTLRSMGLRALTNQGTCVVIAFVLWQLSIDNSFWEALVFSLTIGNCCWLLIDIGRLLAARWLYARRGGLPNWPGWTWMAPIVVFGSTLGYVVGHALAKLLLGIPTTQSALHTPVLAFSVVAAMVISFMFYARERIHGQQLATEAAQRQASEVQLKLLQSQLEPHMLFNTLANLRVLIGLDAAQAQDMLDHLIAFLRTTLASTRLDRHALVTEFEALNDYLALMRVRMGARLQPHFELPDALTDLPVPPLLLQPLVENAIKHGLEPQVEGGRIEIGARRLGNQLQLRVRDTGIGLAAAAGSGSGGTHFGLEQVRTRLATLFGNQASLTVRPADDAEGGTEAVILMPIQPANTHRP